MKRKKQSGHTILPSGWALWQRVNEKPSLLIRGTLNKKPFVLCMKITLCFVFFLLLCYMNNKVSVVLPCALCPTYSTSHEVKISKDL